MSLERSFFLDSGCAVNEQYSAHDELPYRSKPVDYFRCGLAWLQPWPRKATFSYRAPSNVASSERHRGTV